MEKITYSSLATLGEEFHSNFEQALKKLRGGLGETHPMWIGGQERKGRAGMFADLCPSDSRIVLGRFQQGDSSDADRAVTSARSAFIKWRQTTWRERVDFLRKVADQISERQFELAALLVLEIGKNRHEAIAEVSDASDMVRYYCEQIETNNGFETTMGSTKEEGRSVHKPYGVWVVVSPFDFPLAIPAGMIASALLGGNTVVFKPASDTPFAGLKLFEIFQEARLPDGVLNLITGPGSTVGEALISNPDVDGLAFTGSRTVGMQLLSRFGRERPKPCIAEMGAKNPAIVMPSAKLEDAVEGVVRSAYGMTGQKASACSRLYVHKTVHATFMDMLRGRIADLKVGDPTERDTFMGPLINNVALKRFERTIRHTVVEGRLVCGGRRLRRMPFMHGFFVEPTIFDRLPKDSPLWTDELFVPILSVRNIGSLQEAIYLANESQYGLTAGIFTEDSEEQKMFFEGADAGVLYCNRRGGATTGAWPGVQSFGGWKFSGSTGKNALGPHYLTQFMREQSQTQMRR